MNNFKIKYGLDKNVTFFYYNKNIFISQNNEYHTV